MKDIKHIRRDFHSVAWVMPQGSDLGVPWGLSGQKKFFFQNSTRFGSFCFVALRPKSTAIVIAGRSVHLTKLFPGQA